MESLKSGTSKAVSLPIHYMVMEALYPLYTFSRLGLPVHNAKGSGKASMTKIRKCRMLWLM